MVPLREMSSPSVAPNLTANRRPGSLQPGSNPCRAHPQPQLRLNNNALRQMKMTKTSWHMQLSPLSEMLHLYPEAPVPHISLVFREMWDTAAVGSAVSILPKAFKAAPLNQDKLSLCCLGCPIQALLLGLSGTRSRRFHSLLLPTTPSGSKYSQAQSQPPPTSERSFADPHPAPSLTAPPSKPPPYRVSAISPP